MSFRKLERNTRAREFEGVTMAIIAPSRGRFSVKLFVSKPIAEQLGWKPAERFDIGIGEGPDAGKIQVVGPCDDGHFWIDLYVALDPSRGTQSPQRKEASDGSA